MRNRTRPHPKLSSRTSNAIEVAAAVRKQSRELCDQLDLNLKQLHAQLERSRANIAERRRSLSALHLIEADLFRELRLAVSGEEVRRKGHQS